MPGHSQQESDRRTFIATLAASSAALAAGSIPLRPHPTTAPPPGPSDLRDRQADRPGRAVHGVQRGAHGAERRAVEERRRDARAGEEGMGGGADSGGRARAVRSTGGEPRPGAGLYVLQRGLIGRRSESGHGQLTTESTEVTENNRDVVFSLWPLWFIPGCLPLSALEKSCSSRPGA